MAEQHSFSVSEVEERALKEFEQYMRKRFTAYFEHFGSVAIMHSDVDCCD